MIFYSHKLVYVIIYFKIDVCNLDIKVKIIFDSHIIV